MVSKRNILLTWFIISIFFMPVAVHAQVKDPGVWRILGTPTSWTTKGVATSKTAGVQNRF